MPIVMVCWAAHIPRFLSVRQLRGLPCKVAESLQRWVTFRASRGLRVAAVRPNVRYPTEALCLYPVQSSAYPRIGRVPVSHTTTGRFIVPASGRFFGSRSWRAGTYKSCSLASGRMPQESQSATKYFYRSPIASSTCCALTSNMSVCQTI